MLVKKSDGKQLAIINGFTYYSDYKTKTTTCWRCTSNRICKSRFVVDNEFNILRGNYTHRHDAPKFTIRNGLYVKLYNLAWEIIRCRRLSSLGPFRKKMVLFCGAIHFFLRRFPMWSKLVDVDTDKSNIMLKCDLV